MKLNYFAVFLWVKLRREYGSTTIMFAIMFPLLLMFFSLALDGSHFQASRARLADAMNQGVLAITVDDTCDYIADSTCSRKAENKKILGHYLNYYLPDVEFPDTDLDVIVNLNRDNTEALTSIDYNVLGTAKLHPMFKAYKEVGFSNDINIRADSTAGAVRKNIKQKNLPTDFVFVVDVSSSMRNLLNESVNGTSKYDLLKDKITKFSKEILIGNNKNTIGIVPFSVGVPVKLDKNNHFGGKGAGCSFMGRIKREYIKVGNKDIDFSFWYNKTFPGGYNDVFTQNEKITYIYLNTIGSYLGLTITDMINKKWCTEIDEKPKVIIYNCDADQRANVFKHRDEYDNGYQKVKKLWKLVDRNDYLNLKENGYSNVVNVKTIDLEETLKEENLFSDDSVTTYTYFPYHDENGFLKDMCSDHLYRIYLPHYNKRILLYGKVDKEKFISYAKEIKTPPSYLIELNSDIKVIEEFQSMKLQGGETDSSSGLLRSLPVIAKGNNPRKVIVMVTDGEDSGRALELTKLLHNSENNICEKIRKGLLNYNKASKTTEAEIYYISLGREGNLDERLKFWRDNCVGKNNAFVVTDDIMLMQSLLEISQENRINFIDNSKNNL